MFRLNAKTEAHKRRADDTEAALRTLVPKYLQWAIRQGHFAASWNRARATAHVVKGVVVFVDLKGYTNMTEHLSNMNEAGSAILKEDLYTIDNSADFANQVVSRYWELVVSFVHKHHGDVIKFLGDGLQILFPVDPVFRPFGDQAERACMRRGVLFALELMQALDSFHLNSTHLRVKSMSMKIGLAFGRSFAVVLGGICNRFEFVLSGETANRAARLSELGSGGSVAVLDKRLASAAGLACEPDREYRIINPANKPSPSGASQGQIIALLEALRAETKDEEESFSSPYLHDQDGPQLIATRVPAGWQNGAEEHEGKRSENAAREVSNLRKSAAERSRLKNSMTSLPHTMSPTSPSSARRKSDGFVTTPTRKAAQLSTEISQAGDLETKDSTSEDARGRSLTRQSSVTIGAGAQRLATESSSGGEAFVESPALHKQRSERQQRFIMRLKIDDAITQEQGDNDQQSGDQALATESVGAGNKPLEEQDCTQFRDPAGSSSVADSIGDLEIIGSFVPIFALSQVVSGQTHSHLGSRFVTIMFVQILGIDLNGPLELSLLQTASTEAQLAIYSHSGDLRQIAIDDKGFVIIGVFGISGKDPEESAFLSAFELRERLAVHSIDASIGLASGHCHFGMTGASYRSEFTVVGSTVNMSARLMGRASKISAAITSSHATSHILLDDETRLGLSNEICNDVAFAEAQVTIKGWHDPILAHLLIVDDMDDATLALVAQALGSGPLVVTEHQPEDSSVSSTNTGERNLSRISMESKTDAAQDAIHQRSTHSDTVGSDSIRSSQASQMTQKSRSKRSSLRRRRGSGAKELLEQIQIQGLDELHEVIKHVAVMAAVTPWIESSVLFEVLKGEFVRFDIDYALGALCSRYNVIERVDVGMFKTADNDEHLVPLYKSLQHSFRACLHAQLATHYLERLRTSDSSSAPFDLHETIAMHYALAGDEYHLKAAEHINLCLARLESQSGDLVDPARIEDLVNKSTSLVSSWRQMQQVKAERVQAFSSYYMATFKLRCGNRIEAARAFRRTLLSYNAVAEHFSRAEGNTRRLRRTNALLFVYFMDDAHSFSFRFLCIHVTIQERQRVILRRVQCDKHKVRPEHQGKAVASNCTVMTLEQSALSSDYLLSKGEAEFLRALASPPPKLYQVAINDHDASRHILCSLTELARLTGMSLERPAEGPSDAEPDRAATEEAKGDDFPMSPLEDKHDATENSDSDDFDLTRKSESAARTAVPIPAVDSAYIRDRAGSKACTIC